MPCERKHIVAINREASNWPSCGRACDGECESCYNWHKLMKAIDAALSACDESPWRSMDSAPKDGTWVDVGRYINGEWEYCKSGYFHDAGNSMEGEPPSEFWAGDYDNFGVTDDGGMWLTHWRQRDAGPGMPLPAAPERGSNTHQ